MKKVSHVVRKNSHCPFNVSIEQLLGEHNFNTEDCNTLELNFKNILIQQRKKFETKDSKPFPSQLYLDMSFFILFLWFFMIITSL